MSAEGITFDTRESGLLSRALTMLIRSNLAIRDRLADNGGDAAPVDLEIQALRALHQKATGREAAE